MESVPLTCSHQVLMESTARQASLKRATPKDNAVENQSLCHRERIISLHYRKLKHFSWSAGSYLFISVFLALTADTVAWCCYTPAKVARASRLQAHTQQAKSDFSNICLDLSPTPHPPSDTHTHIHADTATSV